MTKMQWNGFYDYAARRIERKYHLTDATRLGGTIPADVSFAVDDDGNADLTEIQNSYGHRCICMLQGVAGKGEYEGKKVLAIYEYKTLKPLSTLTLLELDPSYNTLAREQEQGFARVQTDTCSYQQYPVISVIESPE